jgi:PAS domain S-box-containing protein
MSEKKNKKELLKGIITRLSEGAKPDVMKEDFKSAFKEVTPAEISRIEQELIKEGMPREKIHKLCDVHLSACKEMLDKEKISVPAGHPIHILMEEHKAILNLVDDQHKIATELKNIDNVNLAKNKFIQFEQIIEKLETAESHYLREENVLFPYLEKHGITEPPAIMWMEHDKIREVKKDIRSLYKEREISNFKDFTTQIAKLIKSLFELISNHFYKENKILFPTSLKIIKDSEWIDIREQFDGIGYCDFTPESAKAPIKEVEKIASDKNIKDAIELETGTLSKAEIEAIFDSMPVDVTFVDKDDEVRYFSQTKDRIFVRSKAIIGRKVQNCHPQKSIHVVNQIVEDFKKGTRDVAAFWINLEGKLIHIRYFPVRNKEGEYLGTLEVTQDITDIKKIEGEKRLLDST